jgi:phage terminase large subunit-like protein
MGLVDELHEHPDATVVDKLRAGTKGRRQALIFEITNSGYNRLSVCWAHHEYSRKILERSLDDDSWFAYVCQLDLCAKCLDEGKDQPTDGCEQCDDWRDEVCWPKVNPGLDTILPRKYLREQVHEAVGMPSKEAIVTRLSFCIWTVGVVRAIPMHKWTACGQGVDPVAWRESRLQRLGNLPCWGGLDLGSTSDLTALCLVFEADPGVEVLPYFWVPRESAKRRTEEARVPYQQWIREGWITVTEGDMTDYDQVRGDINALPFGIRELKVDRLFQGAQLCTQLTGDGFAVEGFGQGFLSMAAPVKRLLELIGSGEFYHGNHPVLTWMASNAVTEMDPAGSLKFSKTKSAEKIDGIVAATMGLAGYMASDGGGSVYDSQGIDYL